MGASDDGQSEQKSYLGRTSGMLEERKANAQVNFVEQEHQLQVGHGSDHPELAVLVVASDDFQLEQKSYLGRTSGMLEERKADAQVNFVVGHPSRWVAALVLSMLGGSSF